MLSGKSSAVRGKRQPSSSFNETFWQEIWGSGPGTFGCKGVLLLTSQIVIQFAKCSSPWFGKVTKARENRGGLSALLVRTWQGEKNYTFQSSEMRTEIRTQNRKEYKEFIKTRFHLLALLREIWLPWKGEGSLYSAVMFLCWKLKWFGPSLAKVTFIIVTCQTLVSKSDC